MLPYRNSLKFRISLLFIIALIENYMRKLYTRNEFALAGDD